MTAPARAPLGVVDEEIEGLQTVAIFCGAGLLAVLFLLLWGWI